ncbi:hypothetical protein GUITHDRAFT_149423 [Guillardia theta CCMP2712]|uniref:Uncharacterized protein n=1 Tax=Guillardia theta (strain CCMP2712) TaxID=905079 RepID=L1I4T6_GUITC|nr:hypothetical protein GUITHDRAFT_149423 [Guillardia theta CCMP2712]EKX31256.1 hypothetical protein GUITHDRAFT_149423 [Guillardia theta CCMP2712]|eukprot:XP_005818236.1 hypothetical protein GUITHDRAFT_149423 [Guillardia theta CCMP2712]
MRAEVSWYPEYVDGTELLYQEAFAIEKRKVATLSTQSPAPRCLSRSCSTVEEKLRHIRKEAADNKAEMEAAHEKELTALMKKQDQELSASRASWAKKEDHMKAKLKSRRAALTPSRIASKSWKSRHQRTCRMNWQRCTMGR